MRISQEDSHSENSKRTNILRLRNIKSKKDSILLTRISPDIALSDLVIITIKFQKNNRRKLAVHNMSKTNYSFYVRLKHGHVVNHIGITLNGVNYDTKVGEHVDQG